MPQLPLYEDSLVVLTSDSLLLKRYYFPTQKFNGSKSFAQIFGQADSAFGAPVISEPSILWISDGRNGTGSFS